MALEMQWIGDGELDRLATVRVQCYAPTMSAVEKYRDAIPRDPRGKSGDYLIARRDGLDVGTATSISLNIWMRGGCVPCQGVAYVGTIKTHRRGGAKGERGIASQIMTETLRMARYRGEVVSALMPFRASFYSHFGYGLAERRTEWYLPMNVLPSGDFDGFRFAHSGDHGAIAELRQREVARGQCNIERSPAGWQTYRGQTIPRYEGMEIVDRPDKNGPVLGWMFLSESKENERTYLRSMDHSWDSIDALKRQLYFLSSLKDQYTGVYLNLPGDLQLNRLLKEDQIPHRPVEHPVAKAKPYTRMQIRVLDHKRLLEAMHLPPETKGKLIVSVRECEGTTSTFAMDIADGRITVAPSTQSPDLECSDVIWASLVSADIPARDAMNLGLIKVSSPQALRLLNAFSDGPAPFCQEYF
jgi:predicted acetyltransferase